MTIKSILAAAMIGGVALTSWTIGASAAVVCNEDGDCWHTTSTYTYPSDAGVVVHPEGWMWGSNEKHKWHEHEGKGYWRKGEWRDE